MAGKEVVVSVKTELNKVIADLQKIAKESAKVGDGLKVAGEDVADALDKQTTRTRDFFSVLRGTSAKVAQEIKKDFMALHPYSGMRENGIILLDAVEGILESNRENESIQEIEAIKGAIQNLRRAYNLDIDMDKAIDDYTGFLMGLERIKYAGLLASQEESPTKIQSEKSLENESEAFQIKDSVENDKAPNLSDIKYSANSDSTIESLLNSTYKKNN